jgi:CMP-N-acetylneuraminic acid synthetase
MGHKNGAVYVASAEWIAAHDFTHAGYAKLVMPDERSLDIDYPEQFE